jgi:hypothetical protein
MSKIKELAGGCMLAACVAAIGAVFIVREAWRLLRRGDLETLDESTEEPLARVGGKEFRGPGQARTLVRFW